jgi:hypothetical protein
MTKTERKEIAAAFKRALSTLPDTIGPQESPYICDQVCSGCYDYFSPVPDRARAIIAERINHCFSLSSWLKQQSEEIADQVRNDQLNNQGRKMQAYRKAWLRELIKEFEA